jgi:hypothetical protein
LPSIVTMADVVPALADELEPNAVRALSLRLRITTGVNISAPQAEHVADPQAIQKVCDALRAMGHAIDEDRT